ncbi:hypothetical protein CAI21_07735 [Alkalilimnicola ehrlichii]|uniref:O-antigen ligase-related domain-containing protein n=1 Tax=Alkalilimnicola ehrlichii TaxID=351052 RepID=A0A3E0WYF8_9GAMM|nr:O-antigen ligase family protein [Alkalilimnicola ehrlichii]RFA30084.1 hypothetical protein CAI21_07735 [Alkalilimnicola ehrlichii]RFA37429.1 hypothetical protein CAL65_09075 [Alkalilimnicola ehrlichii]
MVGSDKLTWQQVAWVLGVVGLYLFAFATFYGVGAGNAALAAMLLALFLQGRWIWGLIGRDPLFWLSVVFLLLLAWRTQVALATFPEQAEHIELAARRWARFGFLPLLLVALWIALSGARALSLLALVLLGFLAKVAVEFEPDVLPRLWEGRARAAYINSAVAFGLWSAIGLLGVLLAAPQWIGQPRWHRLWRGTLWLVAVIVLALLLLASQTRGAWLAFTFGFGACGLILLFCRRDYWRQTLIVALIPCLALALVAWVGSDIFEKRWAQANQELAELLDQAQAPRPESSIGARWAMARLGWHHSWERPWLGWGPGVSKALLEQEELFDEAGYRDFHNGFLEIVLAFGVIGGLLCLAMVGLLVRGGLLLYRRGDVPLNVVVLLAGVFLLLTAGSLNGHVFFNTQGLFLFAVCGGIAYSGLLRNRLEHLDKRPDYRLPSLGSKTVP